MPEQAVVPRVLLVVLLLAWFVLEVRQSLRSRDDALHADRGSIWVLRATAVGAFLAAFVVGALVPAAAIPATLAAWLSVLLVSSGAALRLWSFRTLGRYFTFTVRVSEDQRVVESGPYRLVRHPAYLGMLLALTGVGLLLANWLALLVLDLILVAGLTYRIRVEERALTETIGARWTSYAARTRRLVPFVW